MLIVGEILTSMLFSVLKYIRSCSLLNAWFGYWKLKVENGDSGSSKMSKSAISLSSFVSLGTPICQKKSMNLAFRNKQTKPPKHTSNHEDSTESHQKSYDYQKQLFAPDSHTQVVTVPSHLACWYMGGKDESIVWVFCLALSQMGHVPLGVNGFLGCALLSVSLPSITSSLPYK